MNWPQSCVDAGKVPPLLLAAFLSAVFISIAMPGRPGWWPFLFIALAPLLQFSLYATPFRSCLAGLVSGLLYHVFLLYWVVIVLGRYGGLPLWLAVAALLLLSLCLSFYTAGFCCLVSMLAGRYWQRERSCTALVFTAPLIWVGIEWLQGRLFTGFPWMDLAYGLFAQARLIQAADLGGHHMISFFIVLVNALIVYMFDLYGSQVRWSNQRDKRLLMLACCFVIFIIGYSNLRYKQFDFSMRQNLRARITVVQGNIEQDAKWTPKNKIKTINTYLDLSGKALDVDMSELVVWPETALPFFPNRDRLFTSVQEFVKERNIYLLTGAPYYKKKIKQDGGVVVDYFNSALLLAPDGSESGRYDKRHLVPFGEYVPLRQWLFFIKPLVETVADFTPGSSREPLVFGPLKIGVMICFESIFPDLAAGQVDVGANLLVNLTNDAWYGRSSAPYQTMSMAVFRAIENRRSLVRAANTGISCFVDPAGNILRQSEIFAQAHLTADIPINTQKSVFVAFGRYFGAACFALSAAILFFHGRKSQI